MKDIGAIGSAAVVLNDIRLERRRARELGDEDADVLAAMARTRDKHAAEARKKRRCLQEANDKLMTKQMLNKKLADAEKLLKKKKEQIAEREQICNVQDALLEVRLEVLGHGQPNCGGVKCRKKREDVLNKMALLGSGLSEAQKHEWPWFKDHWERHMHDAHGDNWVATFAMSMQHVLDAHRGLPEGNAFSQFVHDETRRCFGSGYGLTFHT